MIEVKKLNHAFKIQVDETVIAITYAEWMIIKKQMTEILASELFS